MSARAVLTVIIAAGVGASVGFVAALATAGVLIAMTEEAAQ